MSIAVSPGDGTIDANDNNDLLTPLYSSSSASSSIRSPIKSKSKDPINPSLRGVKYVIFPDNRLLQVWDFVIILVIWYYCFSIPFHLGISAGYYSVYNEGFFIFNIVMNEFFLVDTFLAFFRAYRDEHGRIVFSLKTIARTYIKSGWFFVNILASLPASSVISAKAHAKINSGDTDPLDDHDLRAYFILELFKLLRLLRIKKIMNTSELMTRLWERVNIALALTIKFVFLITLVSHWIACCWGLIAFKQAGGFGDALLESRNWISIWYESSYVEGGLNPVGWKNAIPRYWLCLFWAIQSITSIGYGNIAPVTTLEYGFANALMLLCGMFWAYFIGNLVEIVQSMGSVQQEYVNRMAEANSMMNDFTVKDLGESAGILYRDSHKRIRRFITSQRDTATKSWLDSSNTSTLQSSYPTLSILSPELQRVCALHLTRSLLETIPYLSSKFLSPDEQAEIALQCVMIEFSIAEKFVAHPELGRGILVFRQGYATTSRNVPNENFKWHKDLTDRPIDVNEVLVEDNFIPEHQITYHFLGPITKVFFVPRSIIMNVLGKNKRAWKCARWRYFMAAFVLQSLKDSGKTIEDIHDSL